MILLNLGSNIKPRHRHLQMAVEALRCEIPGEYTISDIYESAPWGYESEAPYLNIGVLIHPDDTSLTPLQLLERTERAQAAVDTAPHLDRDGGYIDRRIDIDIIAIDSIVLST
ncbi:MAG: 2-amino-4-hydroxy-6-hydroxymethyldihydropteridine diphosphokinase, partial [Duncaniella sp.]|nr:2-amino-4-hydroxy-6-hydroxymethyldihydropteridine diphosphokinase [Duncaniella sp.]